MWLSWAGGWIKHRLNIRSPEMSNIMQYVRFTFIKQEYLVSTVRNSWWTLNIPNIVISRKLSSFSQQLPILLYSTKVLSKPKTSHFVFMRKSFARFFPIFSTFLIPNLQKYYWKCENMTYYDLGWKYDQNMTIFWEWS